MATHLVRTFGAELHVEDEGSGLAILCLHSLAGSLRMWDVVAAGLRRHMRVVRFDARGHGRSAGNGNFSVERNAEDALAVADALKLPSCVVLGISMGGQTAIRAALLRPSIASSSKCTTVSLRAVTMPHCSSTIRPSGRLAKRACGLTGVRSGN